MLLTAQGEVQEDEVANSDRAKKSSGQINRDCSGFLMVPVGIVGRPTDRE